MPRAVALLDSFDEKVALNHPVALPAMSPNDADCILYFSTIVRNGEAVWSQLPVTDISPIGSAIAACILVPGRTVQHSHGTYARVVGLSKKVGKTVFVSRCDIQPDPTHSPGADPQVDRVARNLLWPALIAGGVVKSGVLASVQPSLQVRDIVVQRGICCMGVLLTIRWAAMENYHCPPAQWWSSADDWAMPITALSRLMLTTFDSRI
ncbi:hypothetical protein AURDEDRAFT_178051 [Auricularia subglabra TFB-10046 SS5]|uniref:Uncharacterized protein n=1 Tax=Auricularia subglabra (strain TFB-10046 / SS5) TaxID=717982 RepID=J0WM30_AURST|nr:hypothetical protein AURDEDRAFT_178051 [Auricularia subglabra TFB-10046 SS5]